MPRFTKARRQNQDAFAAALRPVLEGVGAKFIRRAEVEGVLLSDTYELKTKIGLLHVHVSPSGLGDCTGGAVNTRFEDVETACQFFSVPFGGPPNPLVPLNPHTGKWNHQFYKWPTEQAAKGLGRILAKVL